MDNLWWSKVPNAWSLIKSVSDALLDENNIFLYHKNAIPWRNAFVMAVKEEVRENNSSKGFEFIEGVSDPGKYLLNGYCKAEKRATFRPGKGYVAFFAESDDIVVHNKYFWVLMNNEDEINAWTDFVTEYYMQRPADKGAATFILEYFGEDSLQKRKGMKGINVVDIDDHINEYDKVVFATLAAAGLNEPVLLKNYLTELMVNISGSDMELMAEMVNYYENVISSPYKTVVNIASGFVHFDGSDLNIVFEESEIDHCVWKSQIKIVYPLIEEFRKNFVSKHAESIKIGLPIESADGEQIFEPEQVELGGLVYLLGKKVLNLSEKEHDRLVAFWDARNTLSHLGILSWVEIKELFDI